jgi:hypothetical protein
MTAHSPHRPSSEAQAEAAKLAELATRTMRNLDASQDAQHAGIPLMDEVHRLERENPKLLREAADQLESFHSKYVSNVRIDRDANGDPKEITILGTHDQSFSDSVLTGFESVEVNQLVKAIANGDQKSVAALAATITHDAEQSGPGNGNARRVELMHRINEALDQQNSPYKFEFLPGGQACVSERGSKYIVYGVGYDGRVINSETHWK